MRLLVIVCDGDYKGSQHADGPKRVSQLTASRSGVMRIAPGCRAKPLNGA